MLPRKISKTTKMFLTALCLFSLVFASLGTMVRAAETGTVTATVTAQNISVTITTGGTVAFTTVNVNDTKDTTTGAKGVNDTETAENNGNVSEDFNIKAEDSTGDTGWTLADAAGSEIFTMKSCIATCDATPTWAVVGIDPSYVTLASGIAALGTQDFDLQVGTPITTADYSQQTITVTIQAAEAA